jgi:phage-related protein
MAGRREPPERRSEADRRGVSHRWRFWENSRGDKVVADEIDALPEADALSLHARMKIVRDDGLAAARHLREDVYELDAHGIDRSYRLLFSSEGAKGRVLLAVVLLEKKTQRTPKQVIELALRRRDDWRRRGVE